MRSADQLLRLCRRGERRDEGQGERKEQEQEEEGKSVALAKCLLSAFSDHLGVETMSGSRVYALAAGYKGHLEKDAHLKPPPMLVAGEVAPGEAEPDHTRGRGMAARVVPR